MPHCEDEASAMRIAGFGAEAQPVEVSAKVQYGSVKMPGVVSVFFLKADLKRPEETTGRIGAGDHDAPGNAQEAMVCCDAWLVSNPRLIGRCDPVLNLRFNTIVSRKAAVASELEKEMARITRHACISRSIVEVIEINVSFLAGLGKSLKTHSGERRQLICPGYFHRAWLGGTRRVRRVRFSAVT